MVKRTRKNRPVVSIATRVVFGAVALGMSRVNRAINTAFVERQNGNDRHRNARKSRKTCRSSKDRHAHEAFTCLTRHACNFSWPVRTLAIKEEEATVNPRSPGTAAGLADHA